MQRACIDRIASHESEGWLDDSRDAGSEDGKLEEGLVKDAKLEEAMSPIWPRGAGNEEAQLEEAMQLVTQEMRTPRRLANDAKIEEGLVGLIGAIVDK